MALLYANGAETDERDNSAVSPDQQIDLYSTTNSTCTRSTTTVHGGGRGSWRLTGTAAGTNDATVLTSAATVSTSQTNYASVWIRFADFSLAVQGLRILNGSSVVIATLTVNSTGQLGFFGLKSDGTSETLVTASDTYKLTLDTWHNLEIAFTVNGSDNGTDTLEARFDGTSIYSSTTRYHDTSTAIRLQSGQVLALTNSYEMFVDDIVLCDNSGSGLTSWPRDTRVQWLLPTSDNARGANWFAGTAGTTTTNLYAALDNIPPAGVANASATDTSQIEHTGGANNSYDANMAAYNTLTGLSDTTYVKHLALVANVGEEVSTGTKLLRLEGVSNPSITAGSNTDVGTAAVGTWPTGWTRMEISTTTAPSSVSTAPVMRINRPETASRSAHVSFLGLRVLYQVPAATNELGTAAFTSTSSQTAAGVRTRQAAAAFTATTSQTAAALNEVRAAAAFTADSAMTAAGQDYPTEFGVAAFTADSAMTAAAWNEVRGVAAFTADSSLAASSVADVPAASALSATTSLAAAGTVTSGVEELAAAAFTADAAMAASAWNEVNGAAAFTASSSQAAAGVRTRQGTAALSATTSQAASAWNEVNGAAAFTAATAKTASAVRTQQAAAAFAPATSLAVSAWNEVPGAAALAASTLMSALSSAERGAAASHASASSLTAAATVTSSARPRFSAWIT